MSQTLTDPHQIDNPIVFANPAFSELTGYSENEILGRNCRFLQGPKTSPESISAVRELMRLQAVGTVEVVNYRKDGTPFLNALQIGPIFDDDGNLQFYFGSQLDVTDKRERERQARQLVEDEIFHRLRNVVNVMSVIVRMTAKQQKSVYEFGRQVTERLKALSDAHFSAKGQSHGAVEIGRLVEVIVSAYAPIDEKQFRIAGSQVELSSSLGSVVSLVLHELATNAVKHGALGSTAGRVAITWHRTNELDASYLMLEWAEFGGAPPASATAQGGTAIVSSIVAGANGDISFDWQPRGLVARLRLPLDD